MFGILANPLALKLGAAALVLAALFGVGVYYLGKREGRIENEAGAAVRALSRIQKSEKNNADFNSLSARDRCLVVMRDSRLPERTCDGR